MKFEQQYHSQQHETLQLGRNELNKKNLRDHQGENNKIFLRH